ncbi:hypothetical protein BYT27DRAFT_6612337 [Phlegmacium glaucopus]|nr:hypothetical protein BYT27DRAFT_6612337 [Phlegmacium glaucopus]
MSDAHVTESLQSSPDLIKDTTPPRITPSPDATESELKLSRKREREVSVEPVTTPTASNDVEPLLRERKDSRIPLKKNRRHLDPTVEEEDNGSGSGGSGSTSPPILASPRQEMRIKVRQISQGVEDISWKNMQNATSDKDEDVEIDAEASEITLEPPVELIDKVNRHTVMEEDDSPPESPDDPLLSQSIQNIQDDAIMNNLSPDTPNRLRAGSESGEKGLKRKFLERGTSIGPTENEESSNHAPEALKRPRDESDKDDNPRETKRPSPPPSPPRPSPPPKAHKPSGFMAYASSSSPFASVKGQNIFMSGKATPSPPPFSGTPASAVALSDFNSTPAQPSTTTPTAAKRSGFEAFASTASPFTVVARSKPSVLGSPSILGRAKSPPRRTKAALMSNTFASYAGPVHSFSIPASKRARAGSPNGSSRSSLERVSTVSAFGGSVDGSDSGVEDDGDNQASSFGERLRAAKDYDDEMFDGEPKVQLSEQDVMTGEEDEDTIYSVRGKLFCLDDNSWKEKGTGLLKLNVKREDGTGARLVMRKDAVYTVILNITLFGGMRCSLAQDPRYLRVSAIENGVATTYNIKVSNAGIARDLMEEINSNIPL